MDKKEFMLSQVESWKQSGLAQRAYCLQAGIKLPTFSYWVQKSKNKEAQSGDFIALKKDDLAVQNKYEIVYPNGVVVRLGTASVGELSALVSLY